MNVLDRIAEQVIEFESNSAQEPKRQACCLRYRRQAVGRSGL
jgi:ferric iron reductase protein FhuF